MSDCPIHGNQWCTCNSEVDPSPEWIKAVSDDILLRHHNDCAVHSPTLKPCSCGLETRMRSELSHLRAALASAESRLAIAVQALEKIADKPIQNPQLFPIVNTARTALEKVRSKP